MELLLSKMKNDWTFWTINSQIDILHDYANRGRFFNLAYTTYFFFTGIIYLCLPITPQILDIVLPLNESRKKQTLYYTDYYLDVDEYFYWILIHGYFSSTLCVLVLLSTETMFFTVIQHACGVLAIIGFVDDICDCFSSSFFLVLGSNMIVISVTGVQTVIKLHNLNEAVRFGAFTISQIFHLFYLTFPCQELIDHSSGISSSIYNGCWYQLSSESQKMLLMIMRRSSKPSTFTAGKMYTFSMKNFASILRTSMSYFTMLSSVR